MIRKHSIFELLKQHGLTSTFANGYLARTVEEAEKARIKSVTTVASLSAFGKVRTRDLLEQRLAVSHDITRASLFSRGYGGELLTPEQGAADLVTIAIDHDFTLFEFFETDRVGHAGDFNRAKRVLQTLDRFIDAVLTEAASLELLVVLTSDHGNIEDLSVRSHTRNPVPFMVVGPGEDELRARVDNLTDITPALVEYLA